MSSRLSISVIVLLHLLVIPALAKDWGRALPQDWGEVTDEEFRIAAPVDFPSAGAVILFDKGLATTEMNGMDFRRHIRIKILTPKGLDKVKDVEIEYFQYDDLHDVKAQIIRTKNTVIKLNKDSFRTAQKGAKRICRFSFTEAKPGDIIEYKYKIDYYGGFDKLGPEVIFLFSQGKSYGVYDQKYKRIDRDLDDPNDDAICMRNLPTWFFDHKVYCYSSEFIAKIGANFDYLYLPVNIPLDEADPVVERVKFLTATAYKKHIWHMANVKPFIPDTNSNYDSEVERCGLHFTRFSSRGRGQNRVMRVGTYTDEHWKYVGQNIQGYLNDYAKVTRSMRNDFKEVVSVDDPCREKISRIYNYLNKEFEVDSTGYLLRPTHNNLKNLFKQRHGMPFELNILLVEMLRRAGERAWPVLISTRNKLPFQQSGIFNHMLAMVETDGQPVFVDASSGHSSHQFIPDLCQVGKGLLVDYDNSRIVDISW